MLAAAAVLAFACNHGARENAATNQGASPPPTPHDTHVQQQSNASGSSTVELVGCLQGPAQQRPSAGAPPSQAPAPVDAYGTNGAAAYVLADATIESGGIGANGAGRSGGPFISPGTSVELDGVPPDAQNSVNKRVRIVGRIDARRASLGDTSAVTGSSRNNGTSGSGVGASSEVPGTTAGTTGSASPRDDVRANSTGVAGGVAANAGRRVIVERVETIAQHCAER